MVTRLADGYATLVEGTQGMLNATTQLTQRAIERLQETAAQGREKWFWLALATVAIALALAIVFAVLIARPIRQLDQAIRRMGTADFTHAIAVNGPQDLRYLGQRLDWLRMRLNELEQQQTRFLRHVSHELKTPLTAVREGAELLRDNVGGRLSPEQQEIVRIVRENTLSLQKLIEDLLAYHQARALEPATLAPVVLSEIVRRVLREQKLAAVARMITFETRLGPAVVVGDADKIRTVVDNLVVERDQVFAALRRTIEVELVEQDGFAVLDVSDHGPGIAASERERVFDSFYSGTAPKDGKVKGSGLGLAIARDYALAQSGRIEVLDRRDGQRGVRFRLWLPLVDERRASPTRAARSRARPSPSGARSESACAPRARSRRVLWLAGCATVPEPVLTPQEEYAPETVQVPSPLIEYPPIEPVEPPIAPPAARTRGRRLARPGRRNSRHRAALLFRVADACPAPVAPPAARRGRRAHRAARRLAALRRTRQRRREARARQRDAAAGAATHRRQSRAPGRALHDVAKQSAGRPARPAAARQRLQEQPGLARR